MIFNIKLVKNGKFSFWFLAEKYKEAIEKEGYETVTPVIVSNSTNHTAVCKGEPGMIKAGDLIMTVE